MLSRPRRHTSTPRCATPPKTTKSIGLPRFELRSVSQPQTPTVKSARPSPHAANKWVMDESHGPIRSLQVLAFPIRMSFLVGRHTTTARGAIGGAQSASDASSEPGPGCEMPSDPRSRTCIRQPEPNSSSHREASRRLPLAAPTSGCRAAGTRTPHPQARALRSPRRRPSWNHWMGTYGNPYSESRR